MVDDILLTPEEQDERAKKWLKDNGLALIVGVSLGLGAVVGFNTYKDSQVANAEQASEVYETLLSTVKDSDLADIDDAVNTLKQDYPKTSYAAKAALLKARQLSVSDLDAALDELRWVTANAQEFGLVHAARIREAKILISKSDFAGAKTLAQITPYNGFDSHYYEILADVALGENEHDLARDHYQSAIDNIGASDAAYAAVLTLKLNRIPASEKNSTDTVDSAASSTANSTAAEQSTSEATPVIEQASAALEEAADAVDEAVGAEAASQEQTEVEPVGEPN